MIRFARAIDDAFERSTLWCGDALHRLDGRPIARACVVVAATVVAILGPLLLLGLSHWLSGWFPMVGLR